MSFLGRLLGSSHTTSSPRSPLDDFWFSPVGRQTASGISVTQESALKAPVVYDCLTVLSQTVAALPFAIFERLPGGDKRKTENHPLAALFADPDGESTAHEWFGQLVWDLASSGNAIHEIQSGRLGPFSRFRRHDISDVRIERLLDRTRRWTITEADGRERRLVKDEVWHLRDVPLIDGLVGTSRIVIGAEAIGAFLALQEYGASFVNNDAVPPIIIKHPGQFADAASRENFQAAMKSWFGRKRKSPAVLEFGMDLVRLGTTPEEAQFLETRKALEIEITRLWRMPPHKVGILDKATFSNIEEQSLEFVTDTLTPWLSLIEDSINRFLVLNPRRFFFEFNVAGLLRGDIKARFEAYAQARQNGWLSVNEIRRMENLNPIGPAGDVYMEPLNMVPAGQQTALESQRLLGGPERIDDGA